MFNSEKDFPGTCQLTYSIAEWDKHIHSTLNEFFFVRRICKNEDVAEVGSVRKAEIQELHTAAEAENAEDMRQVAHRLKGMCGQLGCIGMAKVCQQLEDRGESNNLAGIEIVLEVLDNLFSETNSVLQSEYSHTMAAK